MSYNPLDIKDLWDITKIQNLSNPLSPFYVRTHYKHDNYVKKPKKKYKRTEQDDKNNNLLCTILFIIYIVASVFYQFVLKKYLQ